MAATTHPNRRSVWYSAISALVVLAAVLTPTAAHATTHVYTVSGQVWLGAVGTPAPAGVEVHVTDSTGLNHGQTTTDATGHYSLTSSTGSDLGVFGMMYGAGPGNLVADSPKTPVTLSGDIDPVADITLTYALTVAGTVTNQAGVPLTNIQVSADLYDHVTGDYVRTIDAYTGLDGRYYDADNTDRGIALDAVVYFIDPNQTYATTVWQDLNPYDYYADGVDEAAIGAAPPPTAINAHMPRAGSISGSVAAPGYTFDDLNAVGLELLIYSQVAADWVVVDGGLFPGGGAFSIPDIYPGNYRMRAYYQGPNGHVEVTSPTFSVAAGQSRAVGTFSLPFPRPVLVTPPTVSGTPTVGSTWTVDHGTWTAANSFAQAWLRCSAPVTTNFTTVPAGCTAIPGASGTTYLTTSADAGKYLTAQVAAVGAYGSSLSGAISTTALPGPTAPVNTVAPTVSGTAAVGATWTLDTGTWTGNPAPTFVQAWLRCTSPVAATWTTIPSGCTSISGAGTTSYVTTSADAGKYLVAQVGAVNSVTTTLIGTAGTVQIPGPPPPVAPAIVVAPSVSGAATIGATWTLNTGTWSGTPAPTFVQAWLRCNSAVASSWTAIPAGCTAIAGAHALTYVTTNADAGKYLVAQVAGVNSVATVFTGTPSGAQLPAPPTPVAPAVTVAPSVSGATTVGSTWTLNTGTWTGTPAPTFIQAWLRCNSAVASTWTAIPAGCVAIAGARALSYVTTSADAGKFLVAQVGAVNSAATVLLGTAGTTAMDGPPALTAPVATVAPSVSGAATIGATWTLSTGTWTGNPAPTFVQAWLRCNSPVASTWSAIPAGCTAISGARGLSYVTTSADAGKYLVAQVAAVNSVATVFTGTPSGAQLPGTASSAPANTVAPTVSGTASVGATWTLDVGTWTGSPAPTFVQAWLRCNSPVASTWTAIPAGCVAISGAHSLSYVTTSADAGKYLVAQVGAVNSTATVLLGSASGAQIPGAAAPTAPVNTAAPTVSGTATVGSTWTLDVGTWTGNPTPTYVQAWLRCSAPVATVFSQVPPGCVAISGAHSLTYVPTNADIGSWITAQVGAVNTAGTTLMGAVSTTAIGAAV